MTSTGVTNAKFCLSVDFEIAPNPFDIVRSIIPDGRCATARHLGSSLRNTAAENLDAVWLSAIGETVSSLQQFFHDVSVGLRVQGSEMITDQYLPPKQHPCRHQPSPHRP